MGKNSVLPEQDILESITGEENIKNTTMEYRMKMAEKPIYLCRV
jgi:hypothetical protein